MSMPSSFLQEALPAGSIESLNGLTSIWDTFNGGLKQLVGFQFVLSSAIQKLSNGCSTLKTEVEMISRQFFTIDDVIASDFDRNAVQVRIRDGLTIDDALTGLTERLTSLTTRFVHQDEAIQKLDGPVSTCARNHDLGVHRQEVSRLMETVNNTAIILRNHEKHLKDQQTSNNDQWGEIKWIFKSR
jgi:hypothetical protein